MVEQRVERDLAAVLHREDLVLRLKDPRVESGLRGAGSVGVEAGEYPVVAVEHHGFDGGRHVVAVDGASTIYLVSRTRTCKLTRSLSKAIIQ